MVSRVAMLKYNSLKQNIKLLVEKDQEDLESITIKVPNTVMIEV